MSYQPAGQDWGEAPPASQGGGRGGGFMTNSPNVDQKGGSPAGKRERRDPQSLLPVNIHQINSCQPDREGKFRIDGKELSQMTFVAEILSAEVKETYINLELNDGTGSLVCKFYIDQEEDVSKRNDIKEGNYTRVVGNVRSNAGAGGAREKFVVAFQLIPLKDANEITFHMLDTAWSHLVNSGKASASAGVGQQQHVPQSQAHHAAAAAPVPAASAANPMQTAIQKVFAAADPNNESGVSVAEVVAQLGNQWAAADIRAAIEAMAQEGHLYSTIDEEHYKSTSS